jgi:selenocysteine lyase/cysteine desulfurase
MSHFVFDAPLLQEIRDRFYFVDEDCRGKKRIFFENSGGSLRLKEAVAAKSELEKVGECPERSNDIADWLQEIKEQGLSDLKTVVFGGDETGAIVTELTPSQVMYRITRAIVENVPGKNVVTTALEHPSAYDSAKIYAEKMGMEFRVANANPKTGGVDTEEILSLVDHNTCLLSVMSASNISGYIFNLEEIVGGARKIKPDLYIVTDAVQHLPHSAMETKKLQLDGVTYGPYKHFGIRGCGYGYVSDRVANLPHDKLEAKMPNEWELGTYPHPNFAALTKVVDYVCWLGSKFTDRVDRRTQYVAGMDKIHAYEHSLLIRMLEGSPEFPGLRYMDGVEVFADAADHNDPDLIAAIGISGMDYSQAVDEYYKRGVTVFERVNKSLYSKRIVESIGLTGAIRVSPLHCNTFDEIDQFLRVTREIVETMRR